jgi:hypothetical protein
MTVLGSAGRLMKQVGITISAAKDTRGSRNDCNDGMMWTKEWTADDTRQVANPKE